MLAPTTTRETRHQARETKFVTDLAMRPLIIAWAREHLDPDGYGAGEHRDEYSTSTLYLETNDFDVYNRRGSYGRSKYRIRRYGLASTVFIERKFRTERLLAKRRTIVPVEALQSLRSDRPDPTWEGYWFHRRILLRRLNPLVQLAYDRIARVGVLNGTLVRMTIDTNFHALPLPDYAYMPGCGQPFLEGTCIVEVKYRALLPHLFREMAASFGLAVQKISKFRSGLRSLDYPVSREADEQVPHAVPPTPLDAAGRYAD